VGRRSAKEQGPFYLSVLGWLLPWALIAAIVGAAVWVAVAKLGEDEAEAPRAQPARDATPSPIPTETETPEPAPTPTAAPEDKQKKKRKEQAEPPEQKLITEGVTVQVLNATGGVPGKAEEVAERLAGLDYQINAVGTAILERNRTVVYWSAEEWKPAAEALAERFGWRSAPKPADLSPTVSIHVMVGDDEV
jgi:hypothetical protein